MSAGSASPTDRGRVAGPRDKVRALQHTLYRAAKADPGRRFHTREPWSHPGQVHALAGKAECRRGTASVSRVRENRMPGVRREALRCIPGVAGRNSEGGSWVT